MIGQTLEQLVGFSASWIGLVLLAAWRTLPILVVVAGIILACRRKLSPSLTALLLTLIIARLLLPVSIGSPFSLQNPLDRWLSIASEDPVRLVVPTAAVAEVGYLLPPVDSTVASPSLAPNDTAAKSASFPWKEVLGSAAVLALVLISMGLIFRSIFSHLRFAVKLRNCRLLDDQPLVDLLLRESDFLAVGKRPTVREVPLLSAPAVFGIFRQTICFPPNLRETLSEQELRWVIRHELAHIRRRDIPVMFLASLAGAFHWFNPVVWFVVNRLRAAIEAAADQLALKSFEPSEVAGYGNLLLRLAQNESTATKSPTLGMISFTSSGVKLKQRIEQLMRPGSSLGTVRCALVTCLVAGLSIAGLTDARMTKRLPDLNLVGDDVVSGKPQYRFRIPSRAEVIDADRFVAEYDLESIFETMPPSLKESKLPQLEQLTAWLHLPSEFDGKLRIVGNILRAELTAQQHDLLKQTLELWRHGEPQQIVIEARIFETDIDTASSIDWAGQKIDGLTVKGQGSAIAARIGNAELTRFMETIKANPKDSTSQSPTVTVFDGQTAGIFIGCQRPFVTGVEPKANGTLQPVVSLVQDGLEFQLTPKAEDDGGISLEFTLMFAKIGEVAYANLPIRNSGREEPGCTVQVPSIGQFEINSTARVAAGESIVVAVPRVFKQEPGADAESTSIVALTPRIEPKSETPAQAGQGE